MKSRADFIALLSAVGVAFMLGAMIGMAAHRGVDAQELDACRQESLFKRCCQCTQTELGRCR